MSFFGLNVAMQGLFTAKTALSVTNHNITNSNTEGYSRQVAEQKASRALPSYVGKGMIGTGSEITGITNIRNNYYDIKYWNTHKVLGEYNVKNIQLDQLETIFKDLSEGGFNKVFDNMFSSLEELSKNASDDTVRNSFVQSCVAFTEFFNGLDTQLREQQREINYAVKSTVEEINFIASELGAINGQIANLELTGSRANDLRDERANLIDQLSKMVNVQAEEINTGNNKNTFVVSINGQVLVDDTVVNSLVVESRAVLNNPVDEPDLYDIKWENGQGFNTYGLTGEIKGYIDLRDGNNTNGYKGVPYYIEKLDNFIQVFAGRMNDLHDDGQDLYGAVGEALFTGITAKDFAVNNNIVNDPKKIATTKDISKGVEGNEIVIDMLKLKHEIGMFTKGSPASYMQALSAELGIDSKQAKNVYESQSLLTLAVKNQRNSISGVDLDEETTNMIEFKKAYDLAAKMISVMDEIYDVTINRMGV